MSEKLPTAGWNKYFEKTKEQGPRPLLVEALPFVIHRNEGLDLGASALNDTQFLLDEGFKHVTAVDKEPVAREVAAQFPSERLTYTISSFEDFEFPESRYDLVDAQYSLPFISKENFDAVFAKIKASLVKHGVFTGQLFGKRDSWNEPSSEMNFHERINAEKLFSDMEMIKFEEQEHDAPTAISPTLKHWHIFHIIAKGK